MRLQKRNNPGMFLSVCFLRAGLYHQIVFDSESRPAALTYAPRLPAPASDPRELLDDHAASVRNATVGLPDGAVHHMPEKTKVLCRVNQ